MRVPRISKCRVVYVEVLKCQVKKVYMVAGRNGDGGSIIF